MSERELIIGHSEGKISDKYRIFLPRFTKVAPGDNLIFSKTNFLEQQSLKIIAYKNYLEIIDRLKNLRNNAQSLEEYNRFSEEIEKICFSLESTSAVDAQKRIALPKFIVEEFDWQIGDTISYYGLGESILIRKKNK